MLIATASIEDGEDLERGRRAIRSRGADSLAVAELGGGVRAWFARDERVDFAVHEDVALIVKGHVREIERSLETFPLSRPISAASLLARWVDQGDEALRELTSDCAVVIFDHRQGDCHLFVDAFGLESLFYQVDPSGVTISTDVLPLAVIHTAAVLNTSAMQDVFTLRFLSAQQSLWTGVKQVVAGSKISIDRGGRTTETKVKRYDFAESQTPTQTALATDLIGERLDRIFERRRAEGVDNVAVLLSGGVDSSVMAALAARTFKTCTAFTACVDGYDNLELERARTVADRLNIRHEVVRVSPDDVQRLFSPIVRAVQEPLRHYNNFVVARLLEAAAPVSQCVVAGDTADLLFGGGDLTTIWHYAQKRRAIDPMPAALQAFFAKVAAIVPGVEGTSLVDVLSSTLPELTQRFDVIPTSDRATSLLGVGALVEPSPELIAQHFSVASPFAQFQMWHLRTFLTSIYRRNTRLAESFGTEYWYPLMEPGIVEYCLSLPVGLKFDERTHESKPILRTLCDRLVGPDVAGWSKMGFPSPETEWMTGPLKRALEACLADGSTLSTLFDLEGLRSLTIDRDHQTLWTLMTLDETLRQLYAARHTVC